MSIAIKNIASTSPYSKGVKIFVLAFLLLVTSVFQTYAAIITSKTTGGAWTNGSTWVGDVAPLATDLVVIATTGGNKVSLDAIVSCAGLTVNSGSILEVLTHILSIGGNVTNNGTITVDTGEITLTGTANFTNAGTLIYSGTGTLTIGGSFTNTGTLTLGSADVVFAGTSSVSGTVSGFTTTGSVAYLRTAGVVTFTGNVNASSLLIKGNGGTLNLGAGLTHNISGKVTISAGTLNGGSGILNITGSGNDAFKNSSVFLAGTGTVNLGATGNQSISGSKAIFFNNLILSGSGTKSLNNVPVINGVLSMEGSATISAAPVYGINATLKYNTTIARTAGKEWLSTFSAAGGVIVGNTGEITMNSAKILSCGIPLTVLSGATLITNNFDLTLGGNLIQNGTFNGGNSDVTINCALAQSISGFTTTGKVFMTKTGGVATLTGNVNGEELTINGSGGTLNLGTGLNHTFTGDWTRTAGTLAGGSSTVNFIGTGAVFSGTGGTFIPGTGTVKFSATANQTAPALTYYNLTLSGTGNKVFSTTPTVNGKLSIEGTASVTVTNGVITYGPNATLQYNKPAAYTATSEEWITPFTATGGVIIANTGVITMNSAKVLGCGVPLKINTGATLNTNNQDITLGGNFTRNGTFNGGTSNIIIDCTGNQSISGFTTTGTVTLAKTGGTATFTGNTGGGALTVNGTGGTLSLGAGLTHTYSGNVSLINGSLKGGSATLNVNSLSATAWNGTGSNFIAENSNVVFGAAGAQTLSAPSTTFNKVTFSGSGNKTVSAAIVVNAALSVGNTAVVLLANATASTVYSLTLGGVPQIGGSWGGTISSASNKNLQWFGNSTTGIINASTERRFVITGASSQTAGSSQNLTISVRYPNNTIDNTYTGDKSLTFSGASASINPVIEPTVTDKTGAPIPFTFPTTITFTNGIASVTGVANGLMTLYRAESTNIIVVSDGTLSTVGDDRLFVTVSPAAIGMNFTTQPAGGLAEVPWSVQPVVTFLDQYGNIESGTPRDVTLSIQTNAGPGGVLSGTTSVATDIITSQATFSDLSIDKAGGGYTLKATSAGVSDATSSPFDISNPAPALTSISPTSVCAGESGFTLIVNGTDFNTQSKVRINGSEKSTLFVNSGELTAQIPASDIATGGTPEITVYNPTPGGGTSSAITFTVNQIIITPVVSQPSCFGSGSITLSISGGTAPYSYDWDDLTGSNNVSDRIGLAAGIYSVTVTDINGCTATSGTITLNPATGCTGISVCKSDVASVISVDPDPENTSYTWTVPAGATINSGQGTPSISVNWTGVSPGVYQVCVVSGNTCGESLQSCQSVYVTEPSVTAYADPVCEKGILNLYAFGGAQYSWTGPNGFTSHTQFPVIYNASSINNGDYYVTVTDDFGCEATSAKVTVSVNTAPVFTGVIGNTTCGNSTGSVDFNVAPALSMPLYYIFRINDSVIGENLTDLSSGNYTVTVTNSATGCTAEETFVVIDNNGPEVTIAGSANVSCYGESDGSITLNNPTRGTSPYNYLWSDGAITQNISSLQAGTYNVVVTDANGCQTGVTQIITAPSAPLYVEGVITNVNCIGGSTGAINLTITGGTLPYTCTWDDLSGSPDPEDRSSLSAGTYLVRIKDANLCESSLSFTLTQPAEALSVSSSVSKVSCFGGTDGQIILSVSGGTTPYTYSWTKTGGGFTAITKDILGRIAGFYDVTVTDAGGCTISLSTEITQPDVLNAVVVKTDIGCNGAQDGTIIMSSATGGSGNYEYQLNSANWQASENFSGLTPATYGVKIRDAVHTSCLIALGDQTIAEPLPLNGVISKTNISCSGANNGTIEITGPTGGYGTYEYRLNSGTWQLSPDFTGLSAGTYTVQIRDAAHISCVSSLGDESITDPPALSVSAVLTNVLCQGASTGEINITASGGTGSYTYKWENGATDEDRTNLAAGNYSVEVQDGNNCLTSTGFTITQQPALNLSLTETTISCSGENDGAIDLTVSGGLSPYLYSWTRIGNAAVIAATEDISGLNPGSYSITVTDANSCQSTLISAELTAPELLALSTTKSDVLCVGGINGTISLTIDGGTAPYTFDWSNGMSTQNISSLAEGTYNVSVSDSKGCAATTEVTINEPTAGIELYATTTNSSSCSLSTGSIDLTVINGIAPITYVWSGPTAIGNIPDPGNLSPGIYTVSVTDDAGCSVNSSVTISTSPELTLSVAAFDKSCSGNVGSVYAIVTGGVGPYNYVWTKDGAPYGGNTQTLSGLDAGLYSVTVTDKNLCSAVNSGTVNAPDCTPPVVVNETFTPLCDSPFSGSVANETDPLHLAPELPQLSYYPFSIPNPEQGTIVWDSSDNGSFTYTPAAGFYGTFSVNYQVCTSNGACSLGTLTLQSACIILSKTGVYNDFDNSGTFNEGDKINYTFTVTNNGIVALSDIIVTDPKVTINGTPIASLASGISDNTTFSAAYTILQSDIDAGTFTNTATVKGTHEGIDYTATDNDTQIFSPNPSVSLIKTGTYVDNSPFGVYNPGDQINYSFTATNTGNQTLTDITITDPQVSISGDPIPSMAPGVSNNTAYSATYILTQTDINAGTYNNIASVRGTYDGNEYTATDSDTQTLTRNPSITILKTGTYVDNAPAGVYNPGDQITYTFNVSNTGNVPLSSVLVTDLKVTISGSPIVLLDPGASDNTTYTATYTLLQEDITAGTFTNTAMATGTFGSGQYSNVANDTQIFTQPDLSVLKTVDNPTPDVGSNVTFIITASNNGQGAATGVKVSDVMPAGYSLLSATPSTGIWEAPLWTIGDLAEGTSETLTILATVNAAGSYNNTASITGNQPDPVPGNNSNNTTTVPVAVADLAISKTSSPEPASTGQLLTYTLTITNNGPSDAVNPTITDNLLPAAFSDVEYSIDGGLNWLSGWSGTYSYGSSLVSGGSSILLIRGTISPTQCTSVNNTASVASSTSDSSIDNNSATVTTTISDIIPPEITCPDDYGLSGCNTSAITGLTFSGVDVPITLLQLQSTGGIASDNCTIASIKYKDTQSGSNPVIVSRTFTVTDGGGNSTSCIQTITISCCTPPTVGNMITTICSGSVSNVSLPVAGTNLSPITSYVITSSVSAGLTGTGFNGTTADPDAIKNDAYSNETNGQLVVIYTVTPWSDTCQGSSFTVTVTVNPLPTMIKPADKTICNGTNSAINLPPTAGVTYSWTTSGSASGHFACNVTCGNSINQILLNGENFPQTATYVITPKIGGCNGTPQSVVVSVNPTPEMDDPADVILCSGESTNIELTTMITAASVTYTWTAVATSVNLTGYLGCVTGCGTSIEQVLNNSGNVLEKTTYTIRPRIGSCNGPTQIVIVTVNPTPGAPSISTIVQPDCDTATGSIVLGGLPASGEWTVTESVGSSTITGTGTTATFSGLNSATYNFTVTTAEGCTSLPSDDAVINPQPATPVITLGAITNPATCGSNGSIVLSFTGVPNGTYSVSHSTGNFPGVVIASGTATITAPAGTYTDLRVTTNGCTSDFGVVATLTDPATPVITLGAITNPSTCGGNGSIVLNFTGVPDGTYSASHSTGNFPGVTVTSGTATIIAPAGTYSDLQVMANGCTSDPGVNATLTDPATPVITLGAITNPSTCGGNGSMVLNFTGVPNGTYSVSHSAGSFSGVVIASGTATITAPAGTYTDLQVTANDCTSNLGVNATLTDPATPIITLGAITNPAICGGDGSIVLNVTNVTDGVYSVSYSLGSFAGVTITSGTATITAPAGIYTNLQLTANGCPSDLGVNASLTDPATPLITLGAITNSATCGGNGSIVLNFTSVPDGTYSVSHSTGNFPGVVIASGTATISAPAGIYTDLQITANGCTSDLGVNATLTDPATPIITLGAITNPSTCGGNGSIVLNFTGVPDGTYSVSHSTGNFPGVVIASGTATISTLAGTYSDLQISANGCTSDLGVDASLSDPATPVITLGAITNPATCGGNGSIALGFSGVPNGTYSVSYSAGNFPGVVIALGTATITAPAGTYTDLQITANGCSSDLGVDASLTDPATPVITLGAITNPAICGGNGSIALSFSGVPDGTYSVSHSTGNFPGVVIASGTATITATAGTYSDLQVTANGCTSDLNVNTTLSNPATPVITLGAITNPATCSGNGSITLSFTGVPNGTYTVSHSTGSFSGVAIASGTATITAPAGTYTDLQVTANGCTSDLGVNATLTDPATPVITLGAITNPATCGGQGSIALSFSGVPDGIYSVSHSTGNFPGVTVTSGTATITAPAGSYTNLKITANGCTSDPGVDATLSDPATPVITLGAITNPATCGGNGNIALSFSGVPNGTYSVSHSTGNFPGVVIASGTATIFAPAGSYTDLQITANGCTSDPGVNATLTDPATPVITLGAITNPATCGGQGSIALSFSGVPNGIYSVSHSTGSFSGVVITSGTATITAPAGTYTDLQVTANDCTSNLGVNATLTDPATPIITLGAITNPAICGGQGSIAISFSGVPDGTYSVSHSTGNFPGVVIASGTATITAPAGTYTNLQITINGCTSDPGVNVTLTDPALPGAPLIGTIVQPDCGTATGTVALGGLPASGVWSVTESVGLSTITGTGTSATFGGLSSATYNFTVTSSAGCTSLGSANAVINPQPATPVITLGAITNPATCGGNGSIALSFTGVPNGTYSVSHSSGNFPGVVIALGTATITAPAGTYNDLQITINGCTSDPGVDASLTDPATPVISLGAITNPATCGGNGSIVLNFTGVPDGTYSVFHSTGSFSGVVIASGTAMITAPAGNYTDFQVTANGCTSDLGVNATLTDPATPVINLGAITNPVICGGNGSIILNVTNVPDGTYSVSHSTGSFPGVVITSGTATISAQAGTYTNLQITANGCTSDLGVNASLTDPATPLITLGAITNSATCGGNGSIVLNVTNVPDGVYTISYTSGSFAGVTVTSGTATIAAPAGTYTDLQLTANGCTSDLGINATLTDPATPVITLGAITNPATCGSNGSIVLSFTGVPNGTYSVSHSTGNFPGVVIASGTATITAPAGTYSDLQISANSCTSDLGVDATLSDPATPVITPGAITNPATCGGNGSIALSFSGVPDGTYSVSHSTGNFPGVTVNAGTATISALAGNYDDLQISANGCTSDPGVNATLTDPATPVITLGSITNAATCGGQGSIVLNFTGVPDGTYSVSHSTGNFPGVVITSGTATISTLAGTYSDLQISANGCTSDLGVDASLTDPATPIITLGAITNPAICSGNGSIALSFSGVQDGTYSVSHSTGSFPLVVIASGTATIFAPAGSYTDLQITANGCSSDLGVDASLTDPATPVITLGAITNPATYGSQGSIALSFLGVPDGTYSVSHSTGNFPGVVIASGTATITAPAGNYSDLQITANGCTSDLGVDATLTDPATPVITLGAITNPATCGGNGSIALSFTGVPNGTYTIFHSTGSFPLVVITSGTATITAPAGNYADLQITANGCISDLGVNATLTDPATPAITLGAITNPAICSGNGSIILNFTGVPNGTYSVSYSAGNFPGVVITSGTATITAPAGTYTDLRVTANGCTSDPGVDATLTDPATPVISLGAITNPATCGSNGSIALSFTGVPDGTYSVSHSTGNFPGVVIASGTATITATAGTYSDLQVTANGCTSDLNVNTTLSNPATPVITLGAITNPATCSGNGSIVLNFTGVPNGVYSISHSSGSFAGITVTSGIATISAPAGTYNDLQITANGCTSDPGVDASLSDPATPIINLGAITNSATCGGNGSIVLNVTNVPDGVYTISYTSGSFAGVTVTSGTATIAAPAGTYTDLQLTANGCTSDLGVDATLSDPATPVITLGAITNPVTCGGNGSIVLNVTNVTDGIYSVSHSSGSFPGVVIASGTATITAPAGTYTNLQITINGCTSDPGVNVTLTDPALPGAPLIGTIVQPDCGTATGTVALGGLPASGVWSVTESVGLSTITGTGTSATFGGLSSATYNFTVTSSAGCTSLGSANAVINPQPATPVITLGAITNPATCGGNGSIALSFSGVQDGTYSVFHSTGSFSRVVITSGTATTTAPAGTYTDLQVTANGCTSDLGVNATLSDPATPVITLGAITNPATCGGSGSIILNVANVPDGVYTISYTSGSFAGVTVTSGTATISTLAGTYSDLQISANGCTSDPGVNATLTDPATPVITPGAITNPATCGGNGSIALSFSGVPDGTYSVSHSTGNFPGVTVNAGTATISALAGNYDDLQISANGCTSDLGVNASLTDPATPAITLGAITNPAICGGNGSIVLNFTSVPDGTYSVSHSTGNFPGVVIASGTATITAPAGTYSDLQISANSCTSDLGVDATLSDPATPVITLGAIANPAICGGNGSIALSFSGVQDGTYSVSHSTGNFPGVTVTAGTATISAPAGNYSDLQISANGCTSDLGVNATLSDPATPVITLGAITNPATCGGQGSIALSFTGVPDGTYSVSHSTGSFSGVVIASGTATITAPAGTYTNLQITANGCTSDLGVDVSLTDPATPVITLGAITNPATCVGQGTIVLNVTNVPDGTYSVSHSTGNFSGVTVTSGTATIAAPAGNYSDLQISANGCTSDLGVNANLTDPSTPVITLGAITNPATCGGNGSIVLNFTGVPDGVYSVSHSTGNFPGVVIASGTATIIAPADTYTDLQISANECNSDLGVDASLSDPATPVITLGAISNPATCGGNGSIILNVPNVTDGIYSISYTSGSFSGVTVTSGTATITAQAGTYSDLQISANGCTSDLGVDATLTDPATPVITLGAITNPATCGGNGSIALNFTGVPNGTYSVSYSAGNFPGVVITSGTATITAPAGTYTDLRVTANGCTSDPGVDATLTDPATPVISLGAITNPATCGSNGSIALSFTGVPDGTYSVSHSTGNFPGVVIASGTATITATAGTYSDLQVTANGCTSDLNVNTTLSNPATPVITLGAITNPATCSGNGSIVLNFTGVPNGVYSISHSSGSFAGITVTSGIATISAPAGTYNDLQITANGCTSDPGVDASLSDPATPIINLGAITNPATCGGNGSIILNVANVPDGVYTISYTSGSFAGVTVTSGTATISAPAGIYTDLQVSANGCTSDLGVNVNLTDPSTPVITLGAITNPATCGGNGSIVVNVTNVTDGVYSVSYSLGSFAGITVTSGIATISAPAGTYTDLQLTANGCTSDLGVNASLTDPANPIITLGAITNPATCGGNGSIALSFSGVPNGTYSVSHNTGNFPGVVIALGTATITAPAGNYSDLQISANGCTSDLGVNATLTDPATPVITLGAITNPSTCGSNGSMILNFTGVPNGTYSVSHSTGSFSGVVITSGTANLTAPAGTYSDLQISANGCTSDPGIDATLTDPATPVITLGAITNPATCGGNGSIVLNFTGVPDGTYTIFHSTGSFPLVAITSGTATITAPAGTYTDLRVIANGCSSDLGVNATLTDPATPVITLGAITNPATCGGNGSIALSFSGVPNGTYTVSHSTGTFPGVVITLGTATITAPAGNYTDLQITANGCSSDLGVDASLTDPATPVITPGAITNPGTCGGNGSIVLSFTGVSNGTYSVSHSTGSFPGVIIASGTATITAPAGTYTDLQITANGCTSDLDVDVSLTDPATPVITLGATTNPVICGGNGSIALSFSGVPNGTYSVSHNTGNFPGVVIALGTATITAPAGNYSDLQISANGCTSDLGVNATLTDPATPVITLGAITNPSTCGSNGSMILNFTGVPNGTYSVSHSTGSFSGVVITSGTANLTAPAGTYSDLQISANGCTSDPGIDATLTDPATPVITLGAITNPATCGGNGSIVLNFTGVPDGTYTIFHSTGSFPLVAITSGTATITAPAGTYTDLRVIANGCSSDLGVNATLTDPATPVITLGAITNPATCGGNGSIALSFSGVPDGTYTVSHSTGTFPGVVITLGTATITAPAGNYTDLQITANGCSSDLGVDASLTDPAIPGYNPWCHHQSWNMRW